MLLLPSLHAAVCPHQLSRRGAKPQPAHTSFFQQVSLPVRLLSTYRLPVIPLRGSRARYSATPAANSTSLEQPAFLEAAQRQQPAAEPARLPEVQAFPPLDMPAPAVGPHTEQTSTAAAAPAAELLASPRAISRWGAYLQLNPRSIFTTTLHTTQPHTPRPPSRSSDTTTTATTPSPVLTAPASDPSSSTSQPSAVSSQRGEVTAAGPAGEGSSAVRLGAAGWQLNGALAGQGVPQRRVLGSLWRAFRQGRGGDSERDRLAAMCRAFRVRDIDGLQDVLNCLVLSEMVYKVVDHGVEKASSVVARLRNDFPPRLVSISRLQWSLPHVTHRYVLAEGRGALYVAFMGTKQRRDVITNTNMVLEPMWPAPGAPAPTPAELEALPAAHRGWLRRSQAVPVERLYAHARQMGKRLVLCGHSMGGAVAELCTLRLLHQLPPGLPPTGISCIGFATPSVGNAALVDLVASRGWEGYFTNILLPEDFITRIYLPQHHIAGTGPAAPNAAAPGPARPPGPIRGIFQRPPPAQNLAADTVDLEFQFDDDGEMPTPAAEGQELAGAEVAVLQGSATAGQEANPHHPSSPPPSPTQRPNPAGNGFSNPAARAAAFLSRQSFGPLRRQNSGAGTGTTPSATPSFHAVMGGRNAARLGGADQLSGASNGHLPDGERAAGPSGSLDGRRDSSAGHLSHEEDGSGGGGGAAGSQALQTMELFPVTDSHQPASSASSPHWRQAVGASSSVVEPIAQAPGPTWRQRLMEAARARAQRLGQPAGQAPTGSFQPEGVSEAQFQAELVPALPGTRIGTGSPRPLQLQAVPSQSLRPTVAALNNAVPVAKVPADVANRGMWGGPRIRAVARTASAAASMMTAPVRAMAVPWWAAQAYVPVGRYFLMPAPFVEPGSTQSGTGVEPQVPGAPGSPEGIELQPSRRPLFAMHRMFMYRMRAQQMCYAAMGCAPPPPHTTIPGTPAPRVTLATDLAPVMRPLRAETVPPLTAPNLPSAAQWLWGVAASEEVPGAAAGVGPENGGMVGEDGGGWVWPWVWLWGFTRDRLRGDETEVEVLISVRGKGLENCCAARIQALDSGGIVAGEIISQPPITLPGAPQRRRGPFEIPLAFLGAAASLGRSVVDAIRQGSVGLGPNQLLLRVRLPVSTLRSLQEPGRTGLGLIAHLDSDFARVALPVDTSAPSTSLVAMLRGAAGRVLRPVLAVDILPLSVPPRARL